MLITQDDLQRIGDEDTLMHFLEEKLNLPIPEEASLAQIALPLPLPFLGLDGTITGQIIDCQDVSGLPKDALGGRRPFLIRFRREQDYPEILRKVAEGLSQKNINPSEVFFICADENFQPFAFAYFNNTITEDWNAGVLNIFIWAHGNTRINAGSEHDLSTIFSSEKSFVDTKNTPETKDVNSDYKDKPNQSKNLQSKLQNIGVPLGRDEDIYRGISLGHKKAFVIDQTTYEQLLAKDPKVVNIMELFPDKPEKWKWKPRNVIYIPSSKNRQHPWSGITNELEAERIFQKTYPAISGHMNHHKNRLKEAKIQVEFYWVYCHRKFRPLSNIRLCYNDNLYFKGAFRWRNAEDSHLSLKQKLCLRPSVVKLHKQNCVDVITSAKTKSPHGNANFLKMPKPSLSRKPISRQMRQRSGLLNLSNSLDG